MCFSSWAACLAGGKNNNVLKLLRFAHACHVNNSYLQDADVTIYSPSILATYGRIRYLCTLWSNIIWGFVFFGNFFMTKCFSFFMPIYAFFLVSYMVEIYIGFQLSVIKVTSFGKRVLKFPIPESVWETNFSVTCVWNGDKKNVKPRARFTVWFCLFWENWPAFQSHTNGKLASGWCMGTGSPSLSTFSRSLWVKLFDMEIISHCKPSLKVLKLHLWPHCN